MIKLILMCFWPYSLSLSDKYFSLVYINQNWNAWPPIYLSLEWYKSYISTIRILSDIIASEIILLKCSFFSFLIMLQVNEVTFQVCTLNLCDLFKFDIVNFWLSLKGNYSNFSEKWDVSTHLYDTNF